MPIGEQFLVGALVGAVFSAALFVHHAASITAAIAALLILRVGVSNGLNGLHSGTLQVMRRVVAEAAAIPEFTVGLLAGALVVVAIRVMR